MSTKRLHQWYDAVGNRVGLTDADGGRFTYACDSLGRISHLENPQNEATSYANDRRTLRHLANGTRTSFTSDGANNSPSGIAQPTTASAFTIPYRNMIPADAVANSR